MIITIPIDYRPDFHLTPALAAAFLVAHLEDRGAVFTLKRDGYLHADLDGMGPDLQDADTVASAVLHFREEIKAILRARAVLH